MIKRLCLFLWIVSIHINAFAIENAAPEKTQVSEKAQVTVSLLNEEATIQPNHPFWVAIRLQLADDWHTYWKNPGDAGMATTIDWQLPEGFTASPFIWPTPERFTKEGVVGYGYKGEIVLLSQITPPATLKDSNVALEAEIKWLVCSDTQCMPGESTVKKTLPVSQEKPVLNAEATKAFENARQRIPIKQEVDSAERKQDSIELKIQLPENNADQWIEVYFFPEDQQVIDHHADVILTALPAHTIIELKIPSKPVKTPDLKGVLLVKGGSASNPVTHSVEIDTPIAYSDASLISMGEAISGREQAMSSDQEFQGGLLAALFLAFLGGMILNLMPCVLPVVSFKILSFVQMAGKSRSLTFKHGLAFFWGVMFSFWTLATMLLVLQAYGRSVGWGFQLQEPLFVAFLGAILLIFALSLFGVFEIGAFATNLAGKVSPRKEGLTGSFLSGILATAVATPCTGPFLGSAIGFAFTVSAPEALLIFTFLGLGMALPYLFLAKYPGLLRFLPRPGGWMGTLKEIMGFVMLATVLWLVWVFSAQTGDLAVMLLLFGFFCISIACWIYGKWGSPEHNFRSRIFGAVFAGVCLLSGGYAVVLSTSSAVELLEGEGRAKSAQDLAWEEFSPERLAELRREGTPVLIDFTAKWCLICQVNHMVLNSDVVGKKFDDLGVVRMKADWTKNDPVITEELRKHGRSGVPLYVLYGKDPDEKATILPQMLTQANVIEHLDSLGTNDEIVSSAN